MRNNNIILVGLMGVGKSAIGKELADRLSMDFLDTDDLLESEQGRTISEIFAGEGEKYFRELESDFLRKLRVNETVVSTGGGLPVFNNNMRTLKEIGTTIYLKISPDKLSKRLWVVRKKRPLLNEVENIDQLEGLLLDQLSKREKCYLESDFVLNVNDKASCEIVEELLTFVKNLK